MNGRPEIDLGRNIVKDWPRGRYEDNQLGISISPIVDTQDGLQRTISFPIGGQQMLFNNKSIIEACGINPSTSHATITLTKPVDEPIGFEVILSGYRVGKTRGKKVKRRLIPNDVPESARTKRDVEVDNEGFKGFLEFLAKTLTRIGHKSKADIRI